MLFHALAVGAGLFSGCERPAGKPGELNRPAPQPPGPAASPCSVRSRIEQDTTLSRACSPYVIPSGGLDILNGATLTIEPGVEVRLTDGDWLEVGAAGKPGRLIAKGTAVAPIVITSNSPETPAPWFGLWFHSGTLPGSELSHAVVSHAGGDNAFFKPPLLQGCITLTGVKKGSLKIADVRAEHCSNGGLRLSDSEVELGRLEFANTAEGFVADAKSAASIALAAQYRDVENNRLLGGTVGSDARWVAQGLPYVVSGDIDVQGPGGPSLALGPGLELQFEKGQALRVGAAQPGRLLIEGTTQAPVKLAARKSDEPWQGIQFMRRSAPGSRISFAEVRGAAGGGALAVRSEAALVEVSRTAFADNVADLMLDCGAKARLAGNRYQPGKGVVQQTRCK